MASSRGDVVVVVMMLMTSSGGDVEVVVMTKVCALTFLSDAFKQFHFRWWFGYVRLAYGTSFLFLFKLGMFSGFIDEIKDAIENYRTSKKDPVAAAAEVASTSGSIACVTQAKAFQDVSNNHFICIASIYSIKTFLLIYVWSNYFNTLLKSLTNYLRKMLYK